MRSKSSRCSISTDRFLFCGADRASAAILAEYSIKHRVNPLNFPMSQGFIVQIIATAAEPVITRRGRLPPTGE
jgi:hypothetical protein